MKSKVKKFICPNKNVPIVSKIVPGDNHATSINTSRLAMSGRETLESSRSNFLESNAVRIINETEVQDEKREKSSPQRF